MSEFDEFDEIEHWQGEEDSLEEFEIAMEEEPAQQKSRPPYEWIALGVVGVLAIASALGLGWYIGNNSNDDSSVSETNQQAAAQSGDTPQNTSDSNDTETSDSATSVDPAGPQTYTVNEFNTGDSPAAIDNKPIESKVAKDGQAWIVINSIDYEMKITGQVKSQETKEALESTVQQYYADSVVSELTVDPSLREAPWVTNSPKLVFFVPFRLADGKVGLGKDGMYLDGDVFNDEKLQEFNQSIQETGVPILENKVAVQQFKRPSIEVTRVDRIVTITGALPSQRAIDQVTKSATSVFGESTVVKMDIDPDRNATYSLAIFPRILSVFEPLDNLEFGLRDGFLYTQIEEGIAFEAGSSELNPTGTEFLTRFAKLVKPLDILIDLEGHTDNVGDEAVNEELAVERANKAADFLVSQEMPRSKIGSITGMGESAPIAANDTEEGRASNRRVELRIGRADG